MCLGPADWGSPGGDCRVGFSKLLIKKGGCHENLLHQTAEGDSGDSQIVYEVNDKKTGYLPVFL